MTTDVPPPYTVAPDERLIIVRRKHWLQYFPAFGISALFLGLSLLIIAAARVIPDQSIARGAYLLGCLLLLSGFHLTFHTLLSAYASALIVTSKRIIHYRQRLFSQDDKEEIPLKLVSSVEARQHGMIQSLLHCGSIWFNREHRILFVSRPHWTVAKISQALGMT